MFIAMLPGAGLHLLPGAGLHLLPGAGLHSAIWNNTVRYFLKIYFGDFSFTKKK